MRHNGQEPDDTRQMLAERDLLSGITEALRGILTDDTTEPFLEGEAALMSLMKAARDREPTMSEQAAARQLGLKPKSLARLRCAGNGPPVFGMVGRKHRYVASALQGWQTATGRAA